MPSYPLYFSFFIALTFAFSLQRDERDDNILHTQCPAHLCNTPAMATIQRESLGLVDRSTTQYAQDPICALLSSYVLYNLDCTVHSRGCWGFFVLRTAYALGDDQRVAAAMAVSDNVG